MSDRIRAIVALAALFLVGCPQPVPEEPVVEPTVEPVVEPSDTFEPDPFGAPTVEPEETLTPTPTFTAGDVDGALAEALAGDLQAAKGEFQRLLSDPELGAYAAYNLGVIAYREGQVTQALSYFEDALDRDPENGPALTAIVRESLRVGDGREAQRRVDMQISRSDAAPSIRAVGLYILIDEGRYEQVIRDGREILLEDEENLDVFFNVATAYRQTDRAELAQFILQEGLARDRSRVEFSLALGQIRMEQGNLTAAQTQFTNALEADPFNAEAHNNLGLVRLRLRNYSRAEESFQSAVQYAPDYAEAWLNTGNARKGQQDYSGAQVAFEQALSIRSGYADAYYNLAILYLDAEMGGLEKQARLEQCIRYFDDFSRNAGSVPADHPYHGYRAEAENLLQIEIDFQAEDAAGGAFGDEGGDDWGDDGDDWGDDGDDWGDDGDDWGDDSDDDWGDDSDDWGDDSDDDWGDDSDDDWGDDSDDWDDDSDDDWGDDTDDDWGDDSDDWGDDSDDWGDDSDDDWGDDTDDDWGDDTDDDWGSDDDSDDSDEQTEDEDEDEEDDPDDDDWSDDWTDAADDEEDPW